MYTRKYPRPKSGFYSQTSCLHNTRLGFYIQIPGGGYGALRDATNIRATAEEREDKLIMVKMS